MTARILLAALAALSSTGIFLATKNHTKTAQLSAPQNHEVNQAYTMFRKKYGKLYSTPDEANYRKTVFAGNFLKIKDSNTQNLTYTLAVNKFADLTPEEMKARYYGLGKMDGLKNVRKSRLLQREDNPSLGQMIGPIPQTKDWEFESNLGEIYHQGGCESCYTFAAVLPLEHLYYRRFGKKVALSQQELVDCSKGHGNTGCRGGWMHYAYDYVIQFDGLQTRASYPYITAEGLTCNQDSSKSVKGLLSSYVIIDPHDTDHMIRALATNALASAVDATDITFYNTGIYNNKHCSSSINHAIVLVGYGTDINGNKYWKVRNSWGQDWGMGGYFKLAREEGRKEGICGITQYNIYPVA